MSGTRQHTIPQSLLKGFEAQRSGKYPQAYVFRKQCEPHLSPTKDIAVQRHFYSKEDPTLRTLDDQITDYEKERFTRLLEDIRELKESDSVDPDTAAEVVVHLTVRGAFLREFFEKAFGQMAAGMGQLMSSSEAARSAFQLDSVSADSAMSREIEEVLQNLAHEVPKDLFRKIVSFAVRENFETFFTARMPLVARTLDDLVGRSRILAKSGHAKALGAGLVPDGRLRHLADFEWRIVRFADKSLILPDCVAVGTTKDGVLRPYVVSDADEVEQIFLPVSSDKLLVGLCNGGESWPLDDFNDAAARCSGEFFVAPRLSDDLISLAEQIGGEVDRHAISLIGDALADIAGRGRHDERSEENRAADAASLVAPNYSIRFLGCVDEDEAKKIASVFNAVVREYGKRDSLERLDEVVFAADYQAAYLQLDRGMTCDPAALGVALGDGIAPVVLRDGQARLVGLFRGEVGRALLAGDDLTRRMGFYIVTIVLLRISHFGRFDLKVPDFLMRPHQEPWDGPILDIANEAFCAYLTRRRAAVLCPEMRAEYRKSAIRTIAAARDRILGARQHLCEKGNVDEFLLAAVPFVAQLLIQLSMMMGSCDGLDQAVDEKSGDLNDALRSVGLRNWFGVFHRDVVTLFERQKNWTKDDLVVFSAHVERILWQFGVFAWKNDSGQTRFNWPLEWNVAQVETFNFNVPASQPG